MGKIDQKMQRERYTPIYRVGAGVENGKFLNEESFIRMWKSTTILLFNCLLVCCSLLFLFTSSTQSQVVLIQSKASTIEFGGNLS